MKTSMIVLALASFSANAADLTPLNCDRNAAATVPWYRAFCEATEADMVQKVAHVRAAPVPSRTVLPLPGLGSADASRYGVACVEGMAMQRLSNGWKQVNDADGNWQRCKVR